MYELPTDPDRSQDGTPNVASPKIAAARDRALAFIVEQRADALKSADGRALGVQARLSRHVDGANAIALEELVQGLVFDPAAAGDDVFSDDPLRGMWREIASDVSEKLGFPLEPELFSNMLVVAQLARLQHPSSTSTARELLRIYRDTSVDGLYHFFSSLRFACDIDCTAVATRGRLASGDLDLQVPSSAATLRRSTEWILRSAAVADVPGEANRSHGKDNGPLHRHVLKVYLDDHTVQGPEHDRGLKHDAVVVCNALWPVLAEIAAGNRSLDERISLREFSAGSPEPRTGEASVEEIVTASLSSATKHLVDGSWIEGTRYYRSPEAFLCAYSELAWDFEPLIAELGALPPLRAAIQRRRNEAPHADPIDVAMRAIAAANAGLDPGPEQELLVATQLDGGGWPGFGALYSFGSNKTPRIYFGSPIVTAAFAARALSEPKPRLVRTDQSRLDPLHLRSLASGARNRAAQ